MNDKDNTKIENDSSSDAGCENSGLSIEESLERIEQLLEKMESDETGLEETFKLYEQGLKLIRDTESSIDKVEKQIKILSGED